MARRRHELTDKQWEKIKGLLPGKADDPGRTAVDNRLFVDAVAFVLKTGIPWADLPGRFGKADTVYKRFDRWCARGVWERVFKAIGEADLDEVQLDSMTARAHPVASTGRRRSGEKKGTPTPADAWAAAGAGSRPRPTSPSTAGADS